MNDRNETTAVALSMLVLTAPIACADDHWEDDDAMSGAETPTLHMNESPYYQRAAAAATESRDIPPASGELDRLLGLGGQGSEIGAELERAYPFDAGRQGDIDYIVARFDKFLNILRKTGGRCIESSGAVDHPANPAPITNIGELNVSAQGHATYIVLANDGSITHRQDRQTEWANGASFSDRNSNAGYSGTSMGENVSSGNGYDSAIASISGWLNSNAGHCSGLFNAEATQYGFGTQMYDGGEWGIQNKGVLVTGK